MKRRLPIGIQTFREIREEGCYYVDRTAHIRRLVDEGKHYFLSRPHAGHAGACACACRAPDPYRARRSRPILSPRIAAPERHAPERHLGQEHHRDTVIPHPHPSDTVPPVREALP